MNSNPEWWDEDEPAKPKNAPAAKSAWWDEDEPAEAAAPEDRRHLGPTVDRSADAPPPWMRPYDEQPAPGSGVTPQPLHTFGDSDLARLFGQREMEPRVSAPLSPEQEADIESKIAGIGGPSMGPTDFSNALLTDRRLGPRLADPRERNPLPEIEVAGMRPRAPVDTRPYADLGSTVSAIPGTVGGRYEMKAIGAQELVASHDARTKYLQAMWLPEAYRKVEEFNRNTPDERDRINFDEDPMVIEMARRAGMRPDQFVHPLYDILQMEREGTLEQFKEENRLQIASQDARLDQLARERQDVAAELARIRPRFRSDFGGNSLGFDAATSFLTDMAPTLVAGVLGGPGAALGTMGGLVLPEEFANLKNEGHSDAEALFGSLARTAAEIAPEGGVMEIALKTATGKEMLRNLIGRLGEGKSGHVIGLTGAEAMSEEVTELINVGLDKGWLNPEMTWSEAFTRLARAPLIGGGMGATMGVFTSPLPEPHIDESAFQFGTPDELPESMPPPPPDGGGGGGYTPETVKSFAQILAGQGGEGFAAPQLPPQQEELGIPDRPKMPFISELPDVSVPSIRLGDGPGGGTMPPPATTGSPVPGVGGAVGPTAPSIASQGTAPERRTGAFVIETMVEDEASKGGAAIVEATPGNHGGWTLIQPDGNVIVVPAEDNRPLEEIVAEYTSKSKDPARVTIRKDQRPLATAFQQSAPPAPSASPEPAPTSAPQAGQTVSPTQESPAGGVASEPRTLGAAVTPKRGRKSEEPSPQGQLFGSQGEVIAPAPAPPAAAPELPAGVADFGKYKKKFTDKANARAYSAHEQRILAVDEEYKRLRQALPPAKSAEHQRPVDEAFARWAQAAKSGTDEELIAATRDLADKIEVATDRMKVAEAGIPEAPSDMLEEQANEFEIAAEAVQATDPAQAARLRGWANKFRERAREKRKQEFKDGSPPAKGAEPAKSETTPAQVVGFHGTNKEFAKFKIEAEAAIPGSKIEGPFHFTDDKGLAHEYATAAADEGGGSARIIEARLHFKNPLVVDAKGASWAGQKPMNSPTFGWQELAEKEGLYPGNLYMIGKALEAGNDGVIVHNVVDSLNKGGKPSTVYIAFNSEQIEQLSAPAPVQAAPPKAIAPTAPATPVTAPTPKAEPQGESTSSRFEELLTAAARREVMESQGQAILDDMEEKGVAPKAVATEFWTQTYPQMSPEARKYFERHAYAQAQIKPGDTTAVHADGRKETANDWPGVGLFLAGDSPASAGDLEGTERGYTALMEWANQQARARPQQPKLPAPAATEQPGPAAAPAAPKPAAEEADALSLDPGIDADAPVPTLDEQADAVDRAADEAEEEGNEDEADSLRRYANELRKGAAPREETDEVDKQAAPVQTETPAFRKWFGDSKVVDKSGNPLVVYHGTAADFDKFEQGKGGFATDKQGYYFTDKPGLASAYAAGLSVPLSEYQPGASVMPVYLSIQNPYRPPQSSKEHSYISAKRRAELEGQGYDGVIFRSKDGKTDEYIVFHPSQVKSAISNSGEFSRDNPSITDEENDALRRPKRKKSNAQPGPFSMSREGTQRAAPDNIWTANGLDADLMENMPPPRRFAKAAELIKKQFGFRDIQKDNNLNWGEAIDALKDAWIGLTNLAAVQNVNPEFMSLNGRLALQMHREYEGALAYYSPGTKTIGVTRRNDFFAHEWAHALDHWLIENFAQDIMQFKGRHLTGKTRQGGTTQTLDQQVRDAFIDVLNAMYFDSAKAAAYVADLQAKIAAAKSDKQKAALQKQLDTFKAGHSKKQDIASEYYIAAKKHDARSPEGDNEDGYWQRPTEMFARVYEAYIANKIAGLPADHPFVTQSKRMYDEGRTGTMKVPYPQNIDRDTIFAALDTLMRAMRDRMLAPTGNAPNTIDPTDQPYWRKLAPMLPVQSMQKARSVLQRLKEPFAKQKAEAHRADRDARARDAQDQRIRDVKLNVAGIGGRRRWLSNQGLKLVEYIKALPAMLAFTIRGNLLSLRDTHKGNAGIAWLTRNFAHDPGANLGTQQKTYSEEIRHWEKYYQNIFAALVKKHGVRGFDNTELRELRDVLVNAKDAATVDPKIKAAAADMRRFLNDMYNYNVSNGVNIGYAKNGYLPRIVDALIVEEDVPGFQTQALKLYKRVYTREVGTLSHVLEDPLKHPERLTNLTQYVREIANNGRVLSAQAQAVALLDDAKALNRALAELKEAAEKGEDTEQLEEQILELGQKIYDGLREPWAMEAANDWEQRIRGGKTPEFAFDQRDPSSKYTKSRVLPEETDAIMGDYLKNDPLELITTYISQSVHRVEFGKFFGNPAPASARQGTPERKLGWKLDEALTQAQQQYTAADGSTQKVNGDHYEELEKSINLLVGRHQTQMTRKALRWKTGFTAALTPVVLARSLWSQFSEPIAIARATGDFTDIMVVFAAQMQDLGALIARKFGINNASKQAAWRREMSEYFGVVADNMADQLMLQRYNLLDMNSSDRLYMQRFFHVTGIHPHAMAMRRASAQVFMQRYAPKIAKRALGTGPRAILARQALAELGLDSKNMDLLRELRTLGDIRNPQQLDKLQHLDHIRTAINRFVDSAVMDPKAVDKPRMASMPEYSYMYGILSFQFAYQRHVLIATKKRIQNAWAVDASIGAAQTASAAANFALLAAAQMGAYALRTMVYSAFQGDDDDFAAMQEKLQQKQLGVPNWAWQSLSRSGMFGAIDPMVNAFMGFKYERDLTQLMAGPLLAVPFKAIQDIVRPIINDTPITADGAYKITEATWKLASIWVTAKALSYAGAASPVGNAVDFALGIGLPFLTSERVIRPTSEAAAELATGLDYLSPATKAAAKAGDANAVVEVEEAKASNKAAKDADDDVDPLADIPDM